jgi:flagellar biosynthesis/type III secretory pathway protein FliH
MNAGITSPRAGSREGRPRSPRDITGRQYEVLHAEHAQQQEIKANPEKYRKVAWNEGFDAGYSKGAEAGLIAGWDDAIAFVIDAGLATQDQVDAAVDAHNAKLAVAGQADTGDEA